MKQPMPFRLVVLLAGLACLLWVEAASARSMVYCVSHPDQRDSFVVGTMHSDDPRVMRVLDDITPLLDRVDTVVLELVPEGVAMLAAGAAMLLPRGDSLQGLLGDEQYGLVVRAARERGLAVATIDRMRPWAVAVMLGMPGSASGRFLDTEIYLAAVARGRHVVGLESVREQIEVFQAMPLALQLEMLDETIKNATELPKQLEKLTRTYLAGDADRLERLGREQLGAGAPGASNWLEQKVLLERNRRMHDRLQPMLLSGGVLVAVGAMHLGGQDGLLAGLGALGYTITPWPG